jgi:fructose-bisphosphate aldolase class II
MRAVLDAAVYSSAPVVIQFSPRTLEFWSAKAVLGVFQTLMEDVDVPATLHLDHCQNPEVIRRCLETGWNSALFDASHLPYDEALASTRELVRHADQMGADIEGEIHQIGRADAPGGPALAMEGLAPAVDFIKATGVTCFSPAVGVSHGEYAQEPDIQFQLIEDLSSAANTPLVLHGGTGLDEISIRKAVVRGVAKVNFSTALKVAYMKAVTDVTGEPLGVLKAVSTSIRETALDCIRIVGAGEKS